MKNFILDLGSVASRLINVIRGGSPDLSYSAQSHLERPREAAAVDWLAVALYRLTRGRFGEFEHCRKAWLAEVEHSRENVARFEAE